MEPVDPGPPGDARVPADPDDGRRARGVDQPGGGDEQAAGLDGHRRAALPRPRRVRRAAAARHPVRLLDHRERAGAGGELGPVLAVGDPALHPRLSRRDRRRPDPGGPIRRSPASTCAAGSTPIAAERCGRRRPARRRPGGRRRWSSTPTATPGQATGSPGHGTPRRRLDRYLRRCDEAGIGRSNLFAAFHSDYAVANEEVGRIVAGRPDRFYGFAFVHADRDRGRILRDGAAGRGRPRLLRDQGAPPRRPHQP